MKRQFQVICWNSDFKRGYREALGLMTRRKQNEIFKRNAHIRQQIVGTIISIISLVLLIILTSFDVTLIWWAAELIPMMFVGFWLLLTPRTLMEEMKEK